MSVFTRLLVIVLVAAVVPLSAALYSHYMTRAERERNVLTAAAEQADSVASALNLIVSAHRELLQLASKAPIIRRGDAAACNTFLAEAGKQFSAATVVGVLDREGWVTCSSRGPVQQAVSNADRMHFRIARETGQFAVGEYVVGRITGQRAIHLSAPVFDLKGEFAGVVNAPLNVDLVAKQLSSLMLPPNSSITVLDPSGVVLVDLPSGKAIGERAPPSLAAVMDTPSGTREQRGPFDSLERIVSWRRVPMGPASFTVAVGLSREEALAPINEATRRTMLLSGVAMIAALLAAWLLARFAIQRPLGRLADAALRHGAGDFTARSGVRGASELGQLGIAFDAMADAIVQRDRSRSRYLAAVSHDLRQPLQALSMSVALLEHRKLPDVAVRQAIARMRRSVDEQSALLDTLMQISQLDAGGVKPDVQHVALQQVLDGVENTFSQPARDKGVALTIERTDAHTRSDPVLLTRLLNNLVSNAVKFTPHGGTVKVFARPEGQTVTLCVADSGVGIDGADHARIFEDFTQLDNPGRERAKGQGLGLGVVRRMSAVLDHPVEVASRAGKGSTFSVRVPLVEGRAPTEAAVTNAPLKFNGRVLLVEDDPLVLEATAAVLEDGGAVVVRARSLSEARSIIAGFDRPFDAVVLDYRLPDGPADSLVPLVRRSWPACRLVLVTGEAEAEDVARLGVPVLRKPASAQALLAALSHPPGASSADIAA